MTRRFGPMMTFWQLSRTGPYEYRSLIPVGATWRGDFNAGRGSADGGRICRRRPVLDALGDHADRRALAERREDRSDRRALARDRHIGRRETQILLAARHHGQQRG